MNDDDDMRDTAYDMAVDRIYDESMQEACKLLGIEPTTAADILDVFIQKRTAERLEQVTRECLAELQAENARPCCNDFACPCGGSGAMGHPGNKYTGRVW